MKRKNKRNNQVVNIGTASMLVILIGMCFTVLSALAISSADSDFRLSEKQAEHTRAYYDASNEAVEILNSRKMEDENTSFEVEINDSQKLFVEADIKNGEINIIRWQVVNCDIWDNDDSLPVLK